jgi:hypothetical protein
MIHPKLQQLLEVIDNPTGRAEAYNWMFGNVGNGCTVHTRILGVFDIHIAFPFAGKSVYGERIPKTFRIDEDNEIAFYNAHRIGVYHLLLVIQEHGRQVAIWLHESEHQKLTEDDWLDLHACQLHAMAPPALQGR